MYVDRLIFKPEHYVKAEKIWKYLKPCLSFTKKQVSIFGGPGTGKSEIAFILKDLYCESNECIKIFHMDNYYKVKAEEREKSRKEIGVIGPDEINWSELMRNVRGNFNSHYVMLLVEGLYAANTPGNNFNIYVQGTADDTLEFRKERGKEDTTNAFRAYVVKRENREVQQLFDKGRVDLCV